MEFRYGTAFLSQSPEAYERLILDAMRGEALLFTRDDEVDALWSIIDPILAAWKAAGGPIPQYPARLAGTPGGGGPDRAGASLAGSCERSGLERPRLLARHDRGGAAEPAAHALRGARGLRARARAQHGGHRRSRGGRARSRTGSRGSAVITRRARFSSRSSPGARPLDAWASVHSDVDLSEPGQLALTHEDIEVDVGPNHVPNLRRSSTPCWCATSSRSCGRPTGTRRRWDAVLDLADVVLLDSVEDLDVAGALGRGRELGRGRHTSWTLRGCGPRPGGSGSPRHSIRRTCAPRYASSSSVTVRHRSDSTAAALMARRLAGLPPETGSPTR